MMKSKHGLAETTNCLVGTNRVAYHCICGEFWDWNKAAFEYHVETGLSPDEDTWGLQDLIEWRSGATVERPISEFSIQDLFGNTNGVYVSIPVVFFCKECGCLVQDRQLHTNWHNKLVR